MTERHTPSEFEGESSRGSRVPCGQPTTTTPAGKVSALPTVEHPAERAARGDRARFDAVLDKVRARNAPPEPGDEL